MSGFGKITNTKSPSAKSDQKPWKCLAITLDPKGERYQTFLENNKHLQVESFQGVKGTTLTKEEMINQGLTSQELAFSPYLKYGLVGNAASHRAIWGQVIQDNIGYFILEDDCYTHPRTADFINDNLDLLLSVDICFFGINTDSILQSISPTGLSSLSLFEPQHPSREWINNALSKTSTEEVTLHRLIKSFGFCAYFISPAGAKKLNAEIFPLSLATTNIPLISERMPAISIDRSGCGAYSRLGAYICQPFLAYTPNIDSQTRE
jgi:glycosyl transferase family 25